MSVPLPGGSLPADRVWMWSISVSFLFTADAGHHRSPEDWEDVWCRLIPRLGFKYTRQGEDILGCLPGFPATLENLEKDFHITI